MDNIPDTFFYISIDNLCAPPKNSKKNILGSYLKIKKKLANTGVELVALRPKPCKRESQCAQLRNLCTSIYFLYCTTCIHFDYEYCNYPLHFLFSFKLLLQNQNGVKITSQSSCVQRYIYIYIYSAPSSSIGKKLMIELVGLLFWMCFVANGVKC